MEQDCLSPPVRELVMEAGAPSSLRMTNSGRPAEPVNIHHLFPSDLMERVSHLRVRTWTGLCSPLRIYGLSLSEYFPSLS